MLSAYEIPNAIYQELKIPNHIPMSCNAHDRHSQEMLQGYVKVMQQK